jgi:hypothetical protein
VCNRPCIRWRLSTQRAVTRLKLHWSMLLPRVQPSVSPWVKHLDSEIYFWRACGPDSVLRRTPSLRAVPAYRFPTLLLAARKRRSLPRPLICRRPSRSTSSLRRSRFRPEKFACIVVAVLGIEPQMSGKRAAGPGFPAQVPRLLHSKERPSPWEL